MTNDDVSTEPGHELRKGVWSVPRRTDLGSLFDATSADGPVTDGIFAPEDGS